MSLKEGKTMYEESMSRKGTMLWNRVKRQYYSVAIPYKHYCRCRMTKSGAIIPTLELTTGSSDVRCPGGLAGKRALACQRAPPTIS
jgi:hypothetical protein